MDCSNNRRLTLLACALLAAATLAAFWPVFQNGFVNYDDPLYITSNPHLTGGLTWANVRWAFQAGYGANWHPLTWVSHMLDVQWFGLKAGGHHFTSLLFHVANAVLLLVVLKRMTGALWRSALVAALFALHPLHVESVAWAAERKDVLSAFFFMLTLWAYGRYAETKRMEDRGSRSVERNAEGRMQGLDHGLRTTDHRPLLNPQSSILNPRPSIFYLLSLVLFALGLMSKPMLVTLPCVLFLLDYWPLGRLQLPRFRVQSSTLDVRSSPPASSHHSPTPLLRLLLEKLPFFALAALSCAVTWVAQTKGEAVAALEKLPFGNRVAHALAAYTDYLQQTFWPAGLSVFYPLPSELSAGHTVAGAAVLAGVTAAVWLLARGRRWAPVGWFWYLGMLVPVIGLVQVGEQARADRYTYLPLIGIFILIAWGAGALASLAASPTGQKTQSSILGALLGVIAAVVLAGLAWTTHRQAGFWRDDRSLFEHAAQVVTNNYVAWQCLGIADLKQKDPEAALANFARANACRPAYATNYETSYFIGAALQFQGKGLEALPYLEQSRVGVEQRPYRDYRLGLSFIAAGRLAEAEAALGQAIAAKPDDGEFQLGMAALLNAQGRMGEAERLFREVANAQPGLAQAHRLLAEFLALHNRPAEAEVYYASALKLQRPDAKLLRAYAGALGKQGKTGEAIRELEAALELEPRHAGANFELAELLSQQGRNREAVARYSQALEADPKLLTALNNLAWLLATCPEAEIRDGPRAVELAERACQITEWKAAFLVGTLAAAQAEAGRFEDARNTAQKAIGLAEAAGQKDLADRNRQLLELYLAGKPFREAAR